MPPRTFNSKRRIRPVSQEPEAQARLTEMAKRARYTGSPYHKKNPGDFGLQPPAAPRLGATLCDGAVGNRAEAQRLVTKGLAAGLISEQTLNGWPQNVWAVTKQGVPVEAQLENKEQGTYHGYPMTDADPLREEVLRRWGAL